MPPVDRANPKRAASSDSRYTVMEFMRDFPDDEACLRWLWKTRCAIDPEGTKAFCPKCELDRKFHRVSGRPAWDCDRCGYHLHPTADTIFHKSSTSLQLWFYAMFLISQTRCGISAKQLERELGVTYKTAWRMLNKIRNQLMDESEDEPLSGEAEADETAIGGKPRQGEIERMRREGETDLSTAGGRWRQAKKTTVVAVVERQGRVRPTVVKGRDAATLKGQIQEHVLPASTIFTDEWPAYSGLDQTYKGPHRIRHSEKVYVSGEVHTQTTRASSAT